MSHRSVAGFLTNLSISLARLMAAVICAGDHTGNALVITQGDRCGANFLVGHMPNRAEYQLPHRSGVPHAAIPVMRPAFGRGGDLMQMRTFAEGQTERRSEACLADEQGPAESNRRFGLAKQTTQTTGSLN